MGPKLDERCDVNVRPSGLPYNEIDRIVVRSVAPRPIGWVSTLSAAGQPNVAPFSFFNAICGKPPLLAFGAGLRMKTDGDAVRGETKDTLRNVRETGEFVVNVVTFDVA